MDAQSSSCITLDCYGISGLSKCVTYMVLCHVLSNGLEDLQNYFVFSVRQPGPEAGSGREDPRSCAVSGPADVRLQGHSESSGVHPLGSAGHCKYTGSRWNLGVCKQEKQTGPAP